MLLNMNLETISSSISDCSGPGLDENYGNYSDYSESSYGNGLLNFVEKQFCSNDVCEDVTVCQVVTETKEKKFYVPVDSKLNTSKEMTNKHYI